MSNIIPFAPAYNRRLALKLLATVAPTAYPNLTSRPASVTPLTCESTVIPLTCDQPGSEPRPPFRPRADKPSVWTPCECGKRFCTCRALDGGDAA